MKTFGKSLWPAIVWTLIIVFLSTTSGKSIPSAHWMEWIKLDKWAHAFLYMVLFILVHRGIKRDPQKFSSRSKFLLNVLYCIGLGILLEWVQGSFLTDRSADLADGVANTFGVLFAIIVVKKSSEKWPWEESQAKKRGDN